MERKFVPILKDPAGQGDLIIFEFELSSENIIDGLLINPLNSNAFPVMNGVPVMLPSSFTSQFLSRHKEKIEQVGKLYPGVKFEVSEAKSWSFSHEWEAHSKEDMETTWGWTIEQRFAQALMETGMSEQEIAGKTILDAGCGNGMLTHYFGEMGMISFGIDYSDSVFDAEKRRTSENVCFIKGDLLHPPFGNESFDLVVSNGVIHHMPSTEMTFYSIASLVRPLGKCYIWLYSRKGNLPWRLKRRFFDLSRMVVSRLPMGVQKQIVSLFTFILSGLKRTGDKNSLRINMYDSLTPRWRHYHTPEEISRWYFKAGFGPVTLTHWDNRYGFGVVATKTHLTKTPGEHW